MNIFISSGFLLFIYMTIMFVIGTIKKDNSIVDNAWGIGFILLTLYSLFSTGSFLPRHVLITTLVIVWGVRLSGHITIKNWGKSEDKRYGMLRGSWMNRGMNYFLGRSFLQIYMLRGLLLFIIVSPVLLVNASTQPGLNLLDVLGVIVWCVGFFFESISDYQLLLFLKEPVNRGNVLMKGLWRYSRHPNYFGEVTMWWGIFLISLNVPYGIFTVISPITITYLLLFVSGVPITEALFDGNVEYQLYKKRTSEFFPWFVRKVA